MDLKEIENYRESVLGVLLFFCKNEWTDAFENFGWVFTVAKTSRGRGDFLCRLTMVELGALKTLGNVQRTIVAKTDKLSEF